MDAILFSGKSCYVEHALRHLANHKRLYWEVGFPIKREKYALPMLGYMHVKGRQVEYKVTIQDIVPFSSSRYEDPEIAREVKPEPWIREWAQNTGDIRSHHWKNALVITMIERFPCITTDFRRLNRSAVKHAPQGYIRVRPWGT